MEFGNVVTSPFAHRVAFDKSSAQFTGLAQHREEKLINEVLVLRISQFFAAVLIVRNLNILLNLQYNDNFTILDNIKINR